MPQGHETFIAMSLACHAMANCFALTSLEISISHTAGGRTVFAWCLEREGRRTERGEGPWKEDGQPVGISSHDSGRAHDLDIASTLYSTTTFRVSRLRAGTSFSAASSRNPGITWEMSWASLFAPFFAGEEPCPRVNVSTGWSVESETRGTDDVSSFQPFRIRQCWESMKRDRLRLEQWLRASAFVG